MIHLQVMQNSEEWYRERLGRPTASSFNKIITPTGEWSKSRWGYLYRLIYERIYQRQANAIKPNYWMARGKALEPLAAKEFERIANVELLAVGLLLTDDRKLGASPDRIINWDHAVEIKCPQPWEHLRYTLSGPETDYRMQIYGHMIVGGFSKVSFFSYCPGMPCVVHTMERDDKLDKKLVAIGEMLNTFADAVDQYEKAARKLGIYIDMEPELENEQSGDFVDYGA